MTHVAGFSASAGTRALALQLGVIDEACDSVAQAVRGADVVLLAVPVQATEASLAAMAPHLHAQALVMDVGSTKQDVVAAARRTLGSALPRFVPAHPVAGKEVAGVAHADATLYQDRHLILTPLPETDPAGLERARALWTAVGSHVSQLDPHLHDAAMAAVSHLPHLAAFALVNAVARQPQGALFLSLAGPGFRDFSRIAASAPSVWRDILLANRTEVLQQAALMRQALTELEAAMQDDDGSRLTSLIDEASQTRSRWRLGGAPTDC